MVWRFHFCGRKVLEKIFVIKSNLVWSLHILKKGLVFCLKVHNKYSLKNHVWWYEGHWKKFLKKNPRFVVWTSLENIFFKKIPFIGLEVLEKIPSRKSFKNTPKFLQKIKLKLVVWNQLNLFFCLLNTHKNLLRILKYYF